MHLNSIKNKNNKLFWRILVLNLNFKYLFLKINLLKWLLFLKFLNFFDAKFSGKKLTFLGWSSSFEMQIDYLQKFFDSDWLGLTFEPLWLKTEMLKRRRTSKINIPQVLGKFSVKREGGGPGALQLFSPTSHSAWSETLASNFQCLYCNTAQDQSKAIFNVML